MNRNELEHIIRAAGDIAGVKHLIILGSQSIQGQFPTLSESFPESDYSEISFICQKRQILCRSIEADIMVPDAEEKADLIDSLIGELSQFHDTFGYYAQGVDHTTSKLPEGWKDHLTKICNSNTNGISGLCLDIHDLIISKLFAARKKDIDFFSGSGVFGYDFRKYSVRKIE